MKRKRPSISPAPPVQPALAAAPPKLSLRQIEQDVLAEGREWTRKRLQKRLQQLADQNGEFSPLHPKKD